MSNGASRIFNVMKKSGTDTVSELVYLTVKSIKPITVILGDKAILNETFLIFNTIVKKENLKIGDKLVAISLNGGQRYFILQYSDSNYNPSIIDNLESTDKNVSLSANQGRILNEKIENIVAGNSVILDVDTIPEITDKNRNQLIRFNNHLYNVAKNINGKEEWILLDNEIAIGEDEPTNNEKIWINDEYDMDPEDIDLLDAMYPVNSIYTSQSNENPGTKFGGTWEKIRTFYGGELLAFGTAHNVDRSATVDSSTYKGWSEIFYKSYSGNSNNQYYSLRSYVDGVLVFDQHTFKVNTKGIVGYVEATIILSGNGTGYGIWFADNLNTLPNNVHLMGNTRALQTTGYNGAYGGTSNQYNYLVDTTADVSFFVNPRFVSYPVGSEFYPGNGGVKCSLNVRVYSAGGTRYMWKRIA